MRLPATRDEVETIGTTKLLGSAATESGLWAALPEQARWRSVHFACHGLVDAERPLMSSLAVTADTENDGFLTALEVFRAKIPTDLVVMSACETAKGKVVKTEGIVGLMRAFMFAGSPRVICSLWKVDDAATQALMIKFYELWNPQSSSGAPAQPQRVSGSAAPSSQGAQPAGLPAAQALLQAQEFIRSHEKWKHPYFWAAWVLWGLPE